jgi:protein-disulfide isomerase
MMGKLTRCGILLVFFALLSTIYFIYVAFGTGIEKHSELAKEHEQEGNSNNQNGFSAVESSNSSNSPNNNTLTKPAELSLSDLISKTSPVIGNKSAPITIVEFGDFQCQFCGRFAKQTEPLLNSTYIQTGKVNLVFKHFVTHGPDSFNAAIASQCANDQGKFWNYYTTLYNNQGAENSGWANIENLKKFATSIPGINIQEFNSCVDNQKYKTFVENDTNFALVSGFQGTPTFIIEKSDGTQKEMLLGAYPFPSFQAIIEKKLSEG